MVATIIPTQMRIAVVHSTLVLDIFVIAHTAVMGAFMIICIPIAMSICI